MSSFLFFRHTTPDKSTHQTTLVGDPTHQLADAIVTVFSIARDRRGRLLPYCATSIRQSCLRGNICVRPIHDPKREARTQDRAYGLEIRDEMQGVGPDGTTIAASVTADHGATIADCCDMISWGYCIPSCFILSRPHSAQFLDHGEQLVCDKGSEALD